MSMSFLNGLGGLSHGSLFRLDDAAVDTRKPPGATAPTIPPTEPIQEIVSICTGQAFLYSPNLVWFLMACGVWLCFPYDLQQRPVHDGHDDDGPNTDQNDENNNEWMILTNILFHRLLINHLLAFGYIGFWHITLCIFHICQRPFVPNREYKLDKVVHNIFYTWLGILHWTGTEMAFIYCYRTGRLEYVPNIFGNVQTALQTLVLSILVPPYRDVHFYFCHRFIHIRCLYKYIHSVHHRNTDIEPFAGLCMHPVEHLYYFTCYGPLLGLSFLPILSPFVVFWMGFHTALSPAASHSGWEDHFSADLAHYLHHRYCDCNYSGGINLDRYFGTYQTTLKRTTAPLPMGRSSHTTSKVRTTTTESESSKARTATTTTPTATKEGSSRVYYPPPPLDSKATLRGWLPEYPLYQFGLLVLCVGSILCFRSSSIGGGGGGAFVFGPRWTAITLSVGPTIWACCLAGVASTRRSTSSWRKVMLSPFDKDSTLSLVLHMSLGVLLGILPATYLLYIILSPVGGA
jgi:sterol desaturase/sphingolipid hydroxylase (fatty acid hydroxylase superfamily)